MSKRLIAAAALLVVCAAHGGEVPRDVPVGVGEPSTFRDWSIVHGTRDGIWTGSGSKLLDPTLEVFCTNKRIADCTLRAWLKLQTGQFESFDATESMAAAELRIDGRGVPRSYVFHWSWTVVPGLAARVDMSLNEKLIFAMAKGRHLDVKLDIDDHAPLAERFSLMGFTAAFTALREAPRQ